MRKVMTRWTKSPLGLRQEVALSKTQRCFAHLPHALLKRFRVLIFGARGKRAAIKTGVKAFGQIDTGGVARTMRT